MTESPGEPSAQPEHTAPLRHTDGPIWSMDFELSADMPSTFGAYELLAELGSGGMGCVYRARQTDLGRIVALKTILPKHIALPDAAHRLRKEAEAAAQLDHPGIVPVYEIGEHDGQLYFTMALVEGQGLDERLYRGPLDNRMAALVVQKIAEAVDYAHRKGVIHRDLKPANVLLDADGGVKVTDFGIARRLNADDVVETDPAVRSLHGGVVDTVRLATEAGIVMGTPGYMAPEQSLKFGRTGPATDIWALGAVLYACLTGRPPFRGASALETLTLTVDSQPLPPERINPDADLELVDICLKCLRKKPEERYRTAQEVADELARWREGQAVRSPFAHWSRRTRTFLASVPELAPLLAGLVVHRLGNIQEGLFVGCALAGILLARRRRRADAAMAALIANVVFVAALALSALVARDSGLVAGGLASLAGLAAGTVTIIAGLSELDRRRFGDWTPARLAAICIPLALVGWVVNIGCTLGTDWLAESSWGSVIVSANRHAGRLAFWLLAIPLGLAVGGLLGRVNQWLDRFGREPLPAFFVAATVFAVIMAWLISEFRPGRLPESSRFAFLGPGPALALAEDRFVQWLAPNSGKVAQVTVFLGLAGILWLKVLVITLPMLASGFVASLALRLAMQKGER